MVEPEVGGVWYRWGGGNSICIDLNPAPGGIKGQIIKFWHDDGRRKKVADSFGEWFAMNVAKQIADHQKETQKEEKKPSWLDKLLGRNK